MSSTTIFPKFPNSKVVVNMKRNCENYLIFKEKSLKNDKDKILLEKTAWVKRQICTTFKSETLHK